MAALCAAPLFPASAKEKPIGWLFIAYAVFSLMGVIGIVTNTPITAGAFIAWDPFCWRLRYCWPDIFRD